MFSSSIQKQTTSHLLMMLVLTSFLCGADCFMFPTYSKHVERSLIQLDMMLYPQNSNAVDSFSGHQKIVGSPLLASVFTAIILLLPPSAAWADGQTKDFKFPPIDYGDKSRCVLKGGSSMGQANAARDKLYDLRQCQLSGANAVGYDLSGVIMTGTDLSKANLKEAQFSKGFLQASNFDGADFSNAIVDRANFQGSSLRGAIFNNAVLTGTSFDGADLENADFTEAAIGMFDVRNICKNPTLKGENPVTGADTRLSVGCS